MDGWMRMMTRLMDSDSPVYPVCAAAAAAFDSCLCIRSLMGTDAFHRFLVHSVLAKRAFTPQGVLFPVPLRCSGTWPLMTACWNASQVRFTIYPDTMDAEGG